MNVGIFDWIGGLLIHWDWALNVALWGSETDAMWPLHCPIAWQCVESWCCGLWAQWRRPGSVQVQSKAQFLWLEAHLHLLRLSEILAQAVCCCDPVAMENLYILGFLAAFTGRITEENVFAARKYKYYREMLIFSLYDDYYQRYARRLHYRALSFIMSPPQAPTGMNKPARNGLC